MFKPTVFGISCFTFKILVKLDDEKWKRVYSISSAAANGAVSPAMVPLAARFATTPSFVTGV
jgi:hypothetical protein